MITVGIILAAGGVAGALVNFFTIFNSDSSDQAVFGRHIGCMLVVLVGLVVLAFGLLGEYG